jgi:transketolase C-terminal domain/subunit/transketolase N-terminal domain/subunit
MSDNPFPIDISQYYPLTIDFDIGWADLTETNKAQLAANIQLGRDIIVFATGLAQAKGVGGHTGGAYDIWVEDEIVQAFIRGNPHGIHPELFDEAGHRSMRYYLRSALDRRIPLEALLHYREHKSGLYGHPERDDARGFPSSTGRLGHEAGFVNGVAERLKVVNKEYPPKKVIMFGSDGSQQEGTTAEAARYAVAKQLDVVWIIDDNDVTIEGNPSYYMGGFDVEQTLRGHGFRNIFTGDGEYFTGSYERIRKTLHPQTKGPVAVVHKRPMAPGIQGLEGTCKGHDAISVDLAVAYLEERGHDDAVAMLKTTVKPNRSKSYRGSSDQRGTNRKEFGRVLVEIMEKTSYAKREKILVVSNDLGGSCGLNAVGDDFPERYRQAGIMEMHNFLMAAGFGREEGFQGVYGTFAAFAEMINSAVTMAGMNHANVLAHFSHSGPDDMADDRCHFGINNLFLDNDTPEEDGRRLYFPADPFQMEAVIKKVFDDPGLRFVFSTRSSVPYILDNEGNALYDPKRGYTFVPGKDEVIREGKDGYIVSYGEMLYRSLDAVEQLKRDHGLEIGLINKATLNVVDEEMLTRLSDSKGVLVVESQNRKTGLGSRFGSWMMERGYGTIPFSYMGTVRGGAGGLSEQITHQGLDPEHIVQKVLEMYGHDQQGLTP